MTGYFSLPALLASLLMVVSSCSGDKKNASVTDSGVEAVSDATLLSIKDCEGYSVATIKNPWDTSKVMAVYVLVSDGADASALPEGTRVKVPLKSSLVYSSVHSGIIRELGAIGSVSGMADGRYVKDSTVVSLIQSGKIADIGNSTSPSIEKIVALEPEAILVSPYQNTGHGAIESMGIPLIEMADYMESTPLGRAEWIKLIGRLYGRGAQADSTYAAVSEAYRTLTYGNKGEKTRVITELPMQGVWSVPGGRSYMASLLLDAGGDYPWADNTSAGSIELDPSVVLDKGGDAKVWIIRSYGPLSRANLRETNGLIPAFKAYSEGDIYVCDTSASALFDEFPFHPELLLAEYIKMLHPSSAKEPLRYFSKL